LPFATYSSFNAGHVSSANLAQKGHSKSEYWIIATLASRLPIRFHSPRSCGSLGALASGSGSRPRTKGDKGCLW
jgi:hypothetical protein